MIAVDVMGGDHAPKAPVLGALRAAKRGIAVTLYGDQTLIIALLDGAQRTWRKLPIVVEHCSQVISMEEKPSRMVLRKKDSSLVCAVRAVANGKAQAIVSAGNSGAMLVAGTLLLGRVRGVHRPAIGQFLPTQKGSIFCLDLGANTDCKSSWLEQFGIIGSVYVRMTKKIERPRVALLSNGVEPHKGCATVKEAYRLLERSPLHFVGNLESRDMFLDRADVLVCDGFSGNVLLKAVEGTAKTIGYWLQVERRSSFIKKLLFLCAVPILAKLRKKTDYARPGGALLLGVKEPMILSHGSSDERAMMFAVEFAHRVVQKNFVLRFNEQLAHALDHQTKGALRMARKVRSMFSRS